MGFPQNRATNDPPSFPGTNTATRELTRESRSGGRPGSPRTCVNTAFGCDLGSNQDRYQTIRQGKMSGDEDARIDTESGKRWVEEFHGPGVTNQQSGTESNQALILLTPQI